LSSLDFRHFLLVKLPPMIAFLRREKSFQSSTMLILQALRVAVRGAGLKPVATVVNVMIHRESLMFTIFNVLKYDVQCVHRGSHLSATESSTRPYFAARHWWNTLQNNLNIFSHFCDVDKTRAHLIFMVCIQRRKSRLLLTVSTLLSLGVISD
jgi:hypothetical protein